MRKLIVQILVLVFIAANAAAQSGRRINNPPPPPPPPEPVQESLRSEPEAVPLGPPGTLPEGLLNHKLQSIDDSTFRLADFAGKVIVVNMWATWCGPCRREVPDYEKVRKEYAGRDVEFIALTTEDPIAARDRVQKFARDFHFGFRIGWADRETARMLMNGRNSIPQTFVIGADGHVINQWTGYSPSHSGDRLREAINRALAGQNAANAADTR
ncbi:MAG TPA: TlpA disulfide reductase family protein [Pyrinomonadaceae bacterium]|jgi:thiol-disulfide isomerase/thioredoxin|nr:TlpA disulfide reductase family protein [Pyrinomonadaceae bacterium]